MTEQMIDTTAQTGQPGQAEQEGSTLGPMLTPRQTAAWPEAISRLRVHYDSLPADLRSWNVVYAEETRPGRGHHVNATWLDGEVFAQIFMDVYGHPNVSIARLSWVHSDSDEECDCAPCETERAHDREEGQ